MHEKCHERCEMLMKTKCNIIVDNTNITCKEMMPYVQLGSASEKSYVWNSSKTATFRDGCSVLLLILRAIRLL